MSKPCASWRAAEGIFDQAVFPEFPFFVAGDADFFASAAGAGAGAFELPVIFDPWAARDCIVHRNFEVGESVHKAACCFGESCAAHRGSGVVDF